MSQTPESLFLYLSPKEECFRVHLESFFTAFLFEANSLSRARTKTKLFLSLNNVHSSFRTNRELPNFVYTALYQYLWPPRSDLSCDVKRYRGLEERKQAKTPQESQQIGVFFPFFSLHNHCRLCYLSGLCLALQRNGNFTGFLLLE